MKTLRGIEVSPPTLCYIAPEMSLIESLVIIIEPFKNPPFNSSPNCPMAKNPILSLSGNNPFLVLFANSTARNNSSTDVGIYAGDSSQAFSAFMSKY